MKLIHKIGIGIAIAGVLVMATGYWAVQKGLRSFLYPLAPPMPAVVDEPMPEILTHLESILKTNAPQVLATLRPGISANQISQLEQQYHVQIPDDVQAIYEWHDGAPANTNYFADFPNTGSFADLIPGHHFGSLEDILEENKETRDVVSHIAKPGERAAYRVFAGYRDNWYCLFDDGSGNGYFFDPTRKPVQGALFCAFVEDNDYTFFPSAKNLMAGIAKCYEQGAYRVKEGGPGPAAPQPGDGAHPLQRSNASTLQRPNEVQLDEDFDQSTKIWSEFGAKNHQGDN